MIDGKRQLLEVHIFDFDQEIYGRYLRVALLKQLRGEWEFKSLAALQKQIAEDAEEAKAFFASKRDGKEVESVP